MTDERKRELLAGLFIERPGHENQVCYASEYLDPLNVEHYAIEQAVSKAMCDSGLSFDFAYSVAEKAVDVLLSIEDWSKDDYFSEDAARELCDNAVPYVTYQLMQIYLQDWATVDEACEAYCIGGTDDDTSTTRAKIGYQYAIENMVQAIAANLASV